MKTSADWLRHFHANTHHFLDIPWDVGAELTPHERGAIARSVQEFQRGESSEGRDFLDYAESYAAATGDRDYVAALRLFISEEQRHARVLARFLAINGIPLVAATFPDRVFRLLRHVLGTLEISVAVLITAEIIAQVYYAALRNATGSVLLKRLCDQILQDEASHVEFQAEQLAKLRARRGPRGDARSTASALFRHLFRGLDGSRKRVSGRWTDVPGLLARCVATLRRRVCVQYCRVGFVPGCSAS